MTFYAYTCPQCGVVDVRCAMGDAMPTMPCPRCGSDARRIYTAPHLPRTPKPLARMLAREEKSREEPDIVTSIPPRKGERPPTLHPALDRLPKQRSEF